MRYWWVNHKQTFRHEFEGRYIWSPKRKRDGLRNRFYSKPLGSCLGREAIGVVSGHTT